MHNAPFVVYPVGRCAFQGWLLVCLGFLTAAVGVLLVLESQVRTLGVWHHASYLAGMFGWLMWVVWACLSWLRSPDGSLQWEPRGAQENTTKGSWSWIDSKGKEPLALSQVERVLDLQSRVLLRFGGQGMGQRWAWAEQSSFPVRWHDLRRALVASRV